MHQTHEACWAPLPSKFALEVEVSCFLPALLPLSLLPSHEAFSWGLEAAPPASRGHLLVRDDRDPPGQGKVKTLWLRSCLAGNLWCPSPTVRAFPSLEKLGQPVFRQRELMICGKPLSGHALSHRAGLRMVWNARHEDYIGVTNRGPKVG